MFECNDESASLFIDILSKLYNSNGKNLKIRVGGKEYDFWGDIDSVTHILIDCNLDGNPIDSIVHRDLAVIRANAINAHSPVVSVTPSPTPATPISDPVTDPSASATNPVVSDDDNDGADVLQGSLADSVKNIIASKVNVGRMFTAFDITKELRQTGTQVNHGREVRPIVNAMWRTGLIQNYTRELVSVNGNDAFVYHPVLSDPKTYVG